MERDVWFRKSMVFLVMLAVICMGGESAWAKEKVYRMKIQSAFPHGDLSMDLLKEFAAAADRRSNGQLKVKVFADPELVPGDQLFGATKQGVVTMLHGMGGMWSGILPIGNVEFSLPLAFSMNNESTFEGKAAAVRDFFFKEGFIELLREEYAKKGLYYLDIHTYGPVPFVLSSKPVTRCSDLDGMKIRAEGINLAFHSGVGMQGTVLSGLETYMALKLGTVDAAEWDVSAVTGLKWHEVAPYWVQGMENDITIGHILVSKKKWDALPDHLKEAMRGAAEDYWNATVKGYKGELDTVQRLIDGGELKETVLDAECRKKYADAAYRIWDRLAGENPANAKAIEMIRKWRKKQD